VVTTENIDEDESTEKEERGSKFRGVFFSPHSSVFSLYFSVISVVFLRGSEQEAEVGYGDDDGRDFAG
jgi:hypothetical protein